MRLRVALSLALAPALGAARSAEAASPRAPGPRATVTVARPAEALAKAQTFLEPAHPRPGTPVPPLLSLLDRLLHAPGAVATSSPAFVLLSGGGTAPVIELAAGKRDAADRALAAAAAALPRARPLPVPAGRDGAALVIGEPKQPELLALRDRAVIAILARPQREKPEDLTDPPALALLRAAPRPARPPPDLSGDTPPDAWLRADGTTGVDRVVGALWIGRTRLEARAALALDLAAGMLLGDLVAGSGARPLLGGLAPLAPVAEVTASLAPDAVAAAVAALELPPGSERTLTGAVHAVLTAGGSALVAFLVAPGAEKTLAATLANRRPHARTAPAASIQARGDGYVLASFLGGKDKAAVTRWLARPIAAASSSGAGAGEGARAAPVQLTATPIRALDALALLDKLNAGAFDRRPPAVPAELRALLASLGRLSAAFTFPPGEVRVELNVEQPGR